MKLTKIVLAVAILTAVAWAQNPDAIDNTRSTMKSLQQIKTNQSNAALALQDASAQQPAQQQTATPAPDAKTATAKKPAKKPATKKPAAAAKPATTKISAAEPSVPQKAAEAAKPEEKKADEKKAEDKKPEEKHWAMSGKRDPFFSPIVQQPTGSGCSTGKKCLEIGQINVQGVVKSDNGFIAVVTNSLNKAYFLHENDPVFNGYVLRITGDSRAEPRQPRSH